ncbi:MAG: DUF4276 family protein [Magnetococcales bacterium]|nr:DUF4276 family protein [Magnetococcales bacterium]
MVKRYVEGGGDTAALKAACREGFSTFITHAGLNMRPRVVACGSRKDAYESFCTAISHGEDAMLLVDSEESVAAEYQSDSAKPETWLPWQHLKQRKGDGWEKPNGSLDTDCHLMVQVMESWFLADRDVLKEFFGQGFKSHLLPAAANAIEGVLKPQIYDGLDKASGNCKTKAPYGKGEHSFKLLAIIDPGKISAASPWARRFLDELKKKMGAKA